MAYEARHWAADENLEGDENAEQLPLWAIFALDPRAARLIVQAAASDQPLELRDAGQTSQRELAERAMLLADFLTGTEADKTFMLGKAEAFLRRDETFARADIPARASENLGS